MVKDQIRSLEEGNRATSLTAFVDTNIFIRYLTGEPSLQANKARALLESGEQLTLTDVVCAELVFVLESVYDMPRNEVAVLIRSILGFPSILTEHAAVLYRAVELYETHKLHFAEAHLAAAAESSGVTRIASFDRQLDRVEGIERIEAP